MLLFGRLTYIFAGYECEIDIAVLCFEPERCITFLHAMSHGPLTIIAAVESSSITTVLQASDIPMQDEWAEWFPFLQSIR